MNLPAISACLLLGSLSLLAGAARQNLESSGKAPSRGASTSQANPGERIFAANCSRCHAAPMGLPPRISGTVIMHMRTRARLSKQDEQDLLRYLAP